MLPTLFISHGAPDVAVAETEATTFLRELARGIPRPDAIVVASAHFESQGRVLVSADAQPETIHDFGGFDPRLYEMRYPAPGDPPLAERIAETLRQAGIDAVATRNRGFDHGTWVPLLLAYPDADIPVVQISVNPNAGPSDHMAMGRALSSLREENVLVIGSGSFTHNLREAFSRMKRGERQAQTPDWVSEFADWMTDRILAGDRQALIAYRDTAPFARKNHPSEEHLMPLYVAMGASGERFQARRLHDSRDFGVLSMEAFAFS